VSGRFATRIDVLAKLLELSETNKRLAEQNARLHGENARLRAEYTALVARVEEFEARLSRNSQNSSKPPSSDGPGVKLPPRKKPTGRKPGGQLGHKGSHRGLLPPEQVNEFVDYWPQQCENCNQQLPDVLRTEVGEPIRHQVTEIPRVVAHVTEHRLHLQYCDSCGHTTQAALAADVPRGAFGVRLQSVIALFAGCYHVGKRAVQGALGDLFGVDLSLGSVSASEQDAHVHQPAPSLLPIAA